MTLHLIHSPEERLQFQFLPAFQREEVHAVEVLDPLNQWMSFSTAPPPSLALRLAPPSSIFFHNLHVQLDVSFYTYFRRLLIRTCRGVDIDCTKKNERK